AAPLRERAPEVKLGLIVEGHGEVEAAPALIRRVATAIVPSSSPEILPPLRINKTKLKQPGELERAVELMARKVGSNGRILVLFDADDDCRATLGPELLERARAKRANLPIGVVIAKREFEGWFIASARALRGRRELPADLEPPPNPETIRDAKGWLS